MKRVAIFAHYDKDCLIDDYVVIYLKNLKECVDDIFFVSDCDVIESEFKKIKELVTDYVCEKHGEYDFGSYKKGIFLLKEKYPNKLNDLDELVFANDSCYPIKDLKNLFHTMSKKECDFWGVTQNKDEHPEHIQSYFIVFKKHLANSEALLSFMKRIKKEKHKKDIIKNYEISMTQILLEEGFKKESFIEKIYDKNPTCSNVFFDELLPKGMPLMKVEMITKNPCEVSFLMEKLKKNFGEDILKIIKNHNKRVDGKLLKTTTEIIRNITDQLSTNKFIFYSKRNKKNELIIKIFRLPVFHSKILKKILKFLRRES